MMNIRFIDPRNWLWMQDNYVSIRVLSVLTFISIILSFTSIFIFGDVIGT